MRGIFAVRNRSTDIRLRSASGGVFSALCAYAMGAGGVVYGATYDGAMRVVHARAETLAEAAQFRGSKYVQSELGSALPEVRADLEIGRMVLFSGTPCQVAGLKSYLSAVGTDTSRLVCVDLICHGPSSPLLWRDHVRLMEKHLGQRVVGFSFRDKEAGWHAARRVALTTSGKSSDRLVSAFGEIFDRNYAQRPSCHACRFANLERCGDLTLGDYWGVEKHVPELDDNLGVSLVFANTAVGSEVLTALESDLEAVSIDVDQCMQPNLRRPTPPSPHRAQFWRVYERSGYVGVIRRYTSYGLVRRWMRRASRLARRLAR